MSGANEVFLGSSFRDNSFYSTPGCLVKGIVLLKLNVYIHFQKIIIYVKTKKICKIFNI